MLFHFLNNHREKISKNLPAIKSLVVLILFVTFVFIFGDISKTSFFIMPKPLAMTGLSNQVIKNSTTLQLPSLPGQPIKWVKTIKASNLNNGEYLLKLPKTAEQIKITPVQTKVGTKKVSKVLSPARVVLAGSDRSKLAKLAKERINSKESLALAKTVLAKNEKKSFLSSMLASALDGFNSSTQTVKEIPTGNIFVNIFAQADKALIVPPVKKETSFNPFSQIAYAQTEGVTETLSTSVETPTDSVGAEVPPVPIVTSEPQAPMDVVTQEITEPAPEVVPTPAEEITPSPIKEVPEILPVPEETIPVPIEEILPISTEEIIPTPTEEVVPLPEVKLDVPVVEAIPDVQVEYETPAPIIAETTTDTGKIVQISSPLEPQGQTLNTDSQGSTLNADTYTNVLAFTTIPEIYKVGQESKIKIKWTNENNQDVTFHAYDTDNNGKLDYVEWTVPHLSTQTFEIIFISKAFQLDSDKNILADIYDTVKEQDGNFATINDGEYIRVTFNDILDNTKDITIHAKGEGKIEIYPKDSNDLIATANVNSENTYRTLLTNLQTPTDTFDLKIVRQDLTTRDLTTSPLEIDYIVDPTAWLTGWSHRKKITISKTNVDADLTNFPALVKISADADLATASSTGADIRFTDSGGRSTLYYERESWTGGGGTAVTANIWVKVATIAHATDTDIYMYYGNDGATDGQSATNVWDSNFKGVWHLNQTGTNPTVLDSTTNANNSNAQVWTPITSGKVGGGATLNGINQYVRTSVTNFPATNAAQTQSIWAYYSSTPSTADLTASVGASNGIQMGFQPGNSIAWKYGGTAVISASSAPSSSTWHLYSFVTNGSNHTLYIDGVSAGTGSVALQDGSPSNFYFGTWNGTDELFAGNLDEVRVSASARAAEWIKFEYHNQADSGNNLTFSAQENNLTWLSGWNFRKKITIDHTKVGATTEDETNFPVLVSLTGLSNINANGTDIRFTSADGGTYLAREIESYSSGTLTAWVKIPTLSHLYDTVIYMYYGNASATEPSASSTYGAQNVWDSNFKGVWHLKEKSGHQNDSTSNNKNTVTESLTQEGTATGKIDGADELNPTNSNYLDWNTNFTSSQNEITISMWVNANSSASGKSLYDTNIGDTYWQFTLLDNRFFTRDSSTGLQGIRNNDLNWSLPTGWHHVVARYSVSGSRKSIYLDGLENVFSATSVDTLTTHTKEYFGKPTEGAYFGGLADEIHISNIARSAGWIATEYANQNSPATFYSTDDTGGTSDNITWTNGSGDNLWSTAGNWQGGVVPGASDTVTFDATASGNVTIDTNVSVKGINITSGYTGTITQSVSYTVAVGTAGYTQAGGTFTAGAGNITDAGTWSVTGGTFTAGTYTVTLNGTSQTISGSTTFYNLTKTVTSADTLTFPSGPTATTTIASGGTLTLTGTAGNLLTLTSSAPTTKAILNVNASATFVGNYLDINYSDASSGRTLVAGHSQSTNSNNLNWSLVAGSVFTWNGSSSVTWATAGNWTSTGGGAPGATDAVVINGTYTNAPTLSTATSIASLTMSGASVLTFNVANTTKASPALTVSGNVDISGTANITHTANSTTALGDKYEITMSVGGNLTLGATATINANGKGYSAGNGPGAPVSFGGGGYGGIGGAGYNGVAGGTTYGSITAPINIGSSGSGGKAGGAVILSVTGSTTVGGTISANAESPINFAGASGGSVYITTGSLSGDHNITANGVTGTNGGTNGSGGGGRVAVIITGTGNDFTGFSGLVTAYGASGGSGNGAAGTVYEETLAQGSGHGTLIIDNNSVAIGIIRTTTLLPSGVNLNNFTNIIIRNQGNLGINTGDTIDFTSVTITGVSSATSFVTVYDNTVATFPSSFTLSGNYTLNIDSPLTATGNWTIASGSNLSHSNNSTTESYKLNITLTGNLTVAPGGTISTNGKGYSAGNGPGAPVSFGGGGYGGIGGAGYNGVAGGTTYGSITAPINIGSSGSGGKAGGAVILSVTGSTTVGGTISANAESPINFAGASGGSVYITTGSLSGDHNITANGVTGTNGGTNGSGGGGRVAVIITGTGNDFTGFSGLVTAYGASGGSGNGAAGTVYKETGTQYALRNGSNRYGDLIINNNNISTASGVDTSIGSLVTDTIVGTVTLTASKAGKLTIASGQALTILGTGTTFTTGTGTTFTNNGTLNLSGTTFTNSGTFTSTASTATVNYTGQTDDSAVTLIPTTYYNLITNNSGTTFGLGGTTTVSGNLTQTAGTIAGGTYNLNVAGNWVGNGNTVTGTSGAVVLNGTSQTISGSTTFNNLTKSVASADTLTFTAGTTQTIAGTLTLNGVSGQLLSLYSSATPAQWNINPQGTRTISYVDVKDSNNTNVTGISTAGLHITDSGHNTNWLFDITAPATSASATAGGSAYTFGAWTKQATVSVSLACTDNDGGVGCDATNYPKYCVGAIDCTPTTHYTTPVSISTEGVSYIRYYSADTIPNTETVKSSAIWIDTTAPAGGFVTYTNGYFTSASIPITYSTGTDSNSGLDNSTGKIQRAEAVLSGDTCGTFSSFSDLVTEFDGSYTDTTVVTATCYKYQYLIQDAVTNQATYTSSNVAKVDTIAPTTSDDFSNNNVWVNTNQTITLTPTDTGGSGVASTKYCTGTDDTCTVSSGTLYTVPVTISDEGVTYFRYASTDNAGNVQTTVSKTVKIDKTAPVISIYGSNDLTVYGGDVYIDAGATAMDSRAGDVTTSIVTINGVNTSALGTYYIYYNVSDDAGNAAVQIMRTVKVTGRGAPFPVSTQTPSQTSSQTFSPPPETFNMFINGGARKTNNPQVTLTLQATQMMAVILSNNPDFSNATTVSYAPTVSFNLCQASAPCADGSYTIYAKFLNAQGVASSAISDSITLDRVPLVTKITDTTKEIITSILPTPIPEVLTYPPIEISVPKNAQISFQNKWKIIVPASIKNFVFADLPSDFKTIASKFPQISKVLKQVGINNMNDISQLTMASLSLPGLSESATLPTASTAGISAGVTTLAGQESLAVQTIPLADLSSKQRNQIPTDIVFARTADEKIDLNTKLSIDNNGLALQTLNTIQGQNLKLVIKPEQPAKSILGYFIFKSNSQAKKANLAQTATAINAFNLSETNPSTDSTQDKSSQTDLVLNKFEYKESSSGVWTADVASPLATGQYELRTVVNYKANKTPEQISMVVVVDPEGYVYEKLSDGREIRLKNAQVSIYKLNSKTPSTSSGQATYELWPASDFRQKNPQTTDVTGRYAFLVPVGTYYLKVTADSYHNYQGEPFKVEENKGVFINIELKPQWSFSGIFNLQNILLGGILIILVGIFIQMIRKKKRQT